MVGSGQSCGSISQVTTTCMLAPTSCLCNHITLYTHTHTVLHSHASRRQSASARTPQTTRHARKYYYERSRAQTAAKQARSTAKQRFHELARLRNTPQNPVLMPKEEIQRMGSKLIVLMDYTATQDNELSVQFAETIFADVLKQSGAERIWAYCPRDDRCGYVPVSLVVPPVV